MDGFPLLEVLSVPEGHGVFNAAPHHARLGHGFREHSVVNLVLHLLKKAIVRNCHCCNRSKYVLF